MKYNKSILILSFIYLIVLEILKFSFLNSVISFSGSKSLAYLMHNSIVWLRLIGIIPFYLQLFIGYKEKNLSLLIFASFAVIYLLFIGFFSYTIDVSSHYKPLKNITFANVKDNKVDLNEIVVGVVLYKEIKAYPLSMIAHHGLILDSVGKVPMLVSYCSATRSSRIYSPIIYNSVRKFKIVGSYSDNYILEDDSTKSWWYQETGNSFKGDISGLKLTEYMGEQMTLKTWIELHPNTLILQQDSKLVERYNAYKPYLDVNSDYSKDKINSEPWKDNSLIIGIKFGSSYKAYDWNNLVKKRVINDVVDNTPISVVVAPDNKSFSVFNTVTNYDLASRQYLKVAFKWNEKTKALTDIQTGANWNFNGEAMDGSLKGYTLFRVQSYQENWGSWKLFHPETICYK